MKPYHNTSVLKGKVSCMPLNYPHPTYLLIKGHVGLSNHFVERIKTTTKICNEHQDNIYIFKFM